MKIIKVNNSQEKVKYEIYNMQLNQEKARIYREELAKKIEFYRLRLPKTDYLNLNNEIFESPFFNTIYGLPNFSVDEYIVDLVVEKQSKLKKHFQDVTEKYLLYRYNQKTKGTYNTFYEERKKFLACFEYQGLLGYNIQPNQYGLNNAFYLFKNGLSDHCDKLLHTDNVICLPVASIALHLIETGNFEMANNLGFFQSNDLDMKTIMENFDFEHTLSYADEEMQELIELGLIKEKTLTRRISQDYNVSSYIK